ncbi:MAG TPA: response regulator transcription factor [Blastocatellia bacterium]|nr:response regulator transcription factor [Blastocatellia bacterium]
MIRILIADDHAVVRRGLKQIVAEQFDQPVIGEAQNASEVLSLVRLGEWDVVVLDISMPGRGGLEILGELKHEHPRLPVLILSVHSEEQYARRALKAGAAGYLNKESAPEELVKAIRTVVAGRKYVSASLAENLVTALGTEGDRAPHETLSDREFQVFSLLASGKTVGEIATQLSLSVKTISTYRTRILEKMRLASNAELIHYAIQQKLVP